jgi:hypothetical protein
MVVAGDVTLRISPDSTALWITRDGSPVLTVPLLQLVDSLAGRGGRAFDTPERLMRIEHREGGAAALLRVTNISGVEGTPRRVTALVGEVYLRLP